MDLITSLRAQAFNNAWANHRLLSTCLKLSDAALLAPRTSFFPSINATLNHILTVDWYYVSALEGECIGVAAFEPEIPFTHMVDVDREQRSVDARLIALFDGDGPDLDSTVELPRADRVQRESPARVLLHLYEHQIHHRGQAHAMLAGTDVAPPQLDEFFLDDDKERSFRRADFQALSFTEEQIWAG
jgi:uncharacterized damage-inducible protein DinB